MSNSAIDRQYENRAIYVVLFLRGAQPGFHWGIFVPNMSPNGHLWHASNRSGGWQLVEEERRVPESFSLCLAFKIGTAGDWNRFCATLRSIPADGTPSRRTGEAFDCVTWAKDALHALHKARFIVLTKSLEEIETWAVKNAEAHRAEVEAGLSSAQVDNKLRFSAA
ncbi:hypothetical protein AC578_2601 [Pseudocercospora eumusae]|uniref:Uncharacterized protein n=1 Tax=Pseudocercospora eumusae TaxID=321146 RepID=A0A139GTW7_9PEZI|nr:hypothetical protein AC578_2601 [Pseudocercospora eumusae]